MLAAYSFLGNKGKISQFLIWSLLGNLSWGGGCVYLGVCVCCLMNSCEWNC